MFCQSFIVLRSIGVFHNHNPLNLDSDLDSLDLLDLWNTIFSRPKSKK